MWMKEREESCSFRNVTEETMGMKASRQELDQGPPAKAVSRPTVTLSPFSFLALPTVA